jgi:hypothetical protein
MAMAGKQAKCFFARTKPQAAKAVVVIVLGGLVYVPWVCYMGICALSLNNTDTEPPKCKVHVLPDWMISRLINTPMAHVAYRAVTIFFCFLFSSHGHGHVHVWVYARLRQIKGTMQGPGFLAGLLSVTQVARLQCNTDAAGWTLSL